MVRYLVVGRRKPVSVGRFGRGDGYASATGGNGRRGRTRRGRVTHALVRRRAYHFGRSGLFVRWRRNVVNPARRGQSVGVTGRSAVDRSDRCGMVIASAV